VTPPKSPAEVVTNPDPTTAVKEALELAVENLSKEIELRFKARDTATEVAAGVLIEKLGAMSSGINDKFTANKDLVDQLAKANATALSAALQTQKESAAKFEAAVADLIKQLQVSFDTANKATNEKIDRLTSRLDLGQGGFINANDMRRDQREEGQDRRGGTKQGLDIIAIIVSLAAVGVAIAIAVLSHSGH
jgi:hypothetical protein